MKKIVGTYDVYGEYGDKFRQLEDYLYEVSRLYNFEYIKTPIIEESSLFHRCENNTSDIVSKHTYDFKDLSGKQITLRPENNSGILRSLIENKLYTDLPRKFYYYGDVFRYDKSQKGRYREFTQFGFEYLGSESILVDTDMVSIAYNIYKSLGINDISLRINSLGNNDDLIRYRSKLLDYFKSNIGDMCEDCQRRYVNNPLRILDCTNQLDKEIIRNAPKLLDNLSKESLIRFREILKNLDKIQIPYEVDKDFIRGIDYQNDTIFEISSTNQDLGARRELCGGGRYDKLCKYLSGRDIPAFGFDFGLERLISCIDIDNPSFFNSKSIDLYIINMCNDNDYFLKVLNLLRNSNIILEYDTDNSSLKSQLKKSDKYNPIFTAFIGEDEIKNNTISIRNNKTKNQNQVDLDNVVEYIKSKKERKYLLCKQKN